LLWQSIYSSLSLDGLRSLSDSAAKALAKHSVENLYLNGLTTLSDAAANHLACHRGVVHQEEDEDRWEWPKVAVESPLFLNGLTLLSDKAVKALANANGNVFFSGALKVAVAKYRG